MQLIYRCIAVLMNISLIKVNTYIEDCIAQKDPLIKILRLVCMQSVCNNGLKQKVLDYYKREILQVPVNNVVYFTIAVCSVMLP